MTNEESEDIGNLQAIFEGMVEESKKNTRYEAEFIRQEAKKI
jgi:hypothetical protein